MSRYGIMESIPNAKDGLIIGKNAVNEAIQSGRPIETLLISKGYKNGLVLSILSKAKEKHIVIKETDSKKLHSLCGGANHQGIAAVAAATSYADTEDIFLRAKERNEPPFIIILNEIEDPHNLGAIIRTAECAGAHGIIIPRRRSAGLTLTTAKVASGAVEYIPVAKVPNISSEIERLQKRGLWIFGADMNGIPYTECDFKGAAALVIGNEGKGLGKLIRQKCDTIVSIPLKGKITSLNASVAAGILIYAITSYR